MSPFQSARTMLLLPVTVGLVACSQPQPMDPDVMVRWQGGQVTRTELDSFILSLPPKAREPQGDQSVVDWRRQMLRSLVARRLLVEEARAKQENQPGLQVRLKDRERAILADAMLGELLSELEPVTEEEIRQYYRNNPEKFSRDDLLNIRHIYLRFRDSDSEDDRRLKVEEMNDLRKQVLAGADFAALAREHSDSANASEGGVIRMFGRGYSFEAFEEAAFALEEGEVSPVFVSPRGVHLVQLETRYEGRTKSLEEATEAIRSVLERQRRQAEAEKLDSELAADFPDQVNLTLLSADDVDPAAELVRVGSTVLTVGDFRTLEPNWQALLSRPTSLEASVRDHARKIRFAGEARRRGIDQRAGVAEAIRVAREALLHEWIVERKMHEAQAAIDRAELLAFYEAHPPLFESPRKIRASRIFLKCEPDEVFPTFLKAEELVQRIRAGESFADLAREYSDGPLARQGGQLPLLGPNALAGQGKEFYETALSLEVGEVSDPVRCPHVILAPGLAQAFAGGMLIVQVDEIEEGRPLEFEEAEQRARRIYMQRHQKRIRMEVDEAALSRVRLEFNEELLDAA